MEAVDYNFLMALSGLLCGIMFCMAMILAFK